MRVKICGLVTPEMARVAAEAGAWAVGVVFAAGPRQVDVATARRVLQDLPGHVARVGVFVDADLGTLQQALAGAGLTHVQLHGEGATPDDVRRRLGCEVIVGVPFRGPQSVAGHGGDLVLYDAAVAGQHGGTGTTLDWDALAAAAPPRPFGLAGGLDAANVAAAIAAVRPDVVDVSSGVESSRGVKDAERIRAFCAAARAASATSSTP